jgi:hypothetical protein
MGKFSQIHAASVSDIDDVDDCDAEYVGAEMMKDETREIDAEAVRRAYDDATTEARLQREQEAERARRWSVGD